MFCQNCGRQNPDGTAFCSNCGSALNGAPVAPVAPVTPVVPTAPAASSVPGKGLGIASMVLGIISLVMFCTGWFAIICAIVGTALGGVALKKAKDAGVKNSMATAGLACSVVALGLAVAVYAYALWILEETANAFGTSIFR